MAAGTIRRRIVFYGWEDIEGLPQFEREASARAVGRLQGADWAVVDDDFVTAVLVDHVGSANEPTCLRCFRLRSGDDVPHVMRRGRVPAPLALEQDEAVTDWTHVVIWPDNRAAHDSRRDAPSLSRLARYLRETTACHVRFFPLYDRTLVDQLQALDDIKAVEIQMQVPRAEQLAEAARGGLFGGLITVGQEAEALVVTAKVSVGRSRRHFLNRGMRDEVVGLAPRAEELLDNLVITGVTDGETVYIDVLKSRLEERVNVRRSRAGF